MLKKFLIVFVLIIMSSAQVSAEKILFIPHDDRPISYQQPVEVVRQLGYKIISPPTELLTQPDELWTWFKENAHTAKAAVVASDALLYGGLIPSRSHNYSEDELKTRVENFKILRESNPGLQLYVFGSLMRTPQQGTPGDIEEPDYYGYYGGKIFQLTRLLDKEETSFLSGSEKAELKVLEQSIPDEILDDWFARRLKNLFATKELLDLTNDNIINCFIIGRDDNAPLSQTHRENVIITKYIKELGIPKTKAQSHAGIDEYAMLLLTRAVVDLKDEFPLVYVQFNRGKGKKTIPAYSDETIADSISDEIFIAGGLITSDPKRADLVLLVNTDREGQTFHTHNSFPPQALTKHEQKYLARNAEKFSSLVEDAVNKKLPVGVADITFANGSDNFLMNQLRDKNLLFKLQAYGGWNTATNTSGFALGTGILAKKMSRKSIDRLLAYRYLDEWAYQANIRTMIASELSKRPDGLQIYLNLGKYEEAIVKRENELMHDFAKKNLPQIKKFTLSNPWHRMFECRIDF